MCECNRTAGTGTAPEEGVRLPLTIYDQMLAYSVCRSYILDKKDKKTPNCIRLIYIIPDRRGEEG